MGKAAEIRAELRKTKDQKWVIDPSTGEIKPKVDPTTDPETPPAPQVRSVQAAYHTYD
jgi:hypothetical protein